MATITLITGGVRSGKSSYALDLAKKSPGAKVFIATALRLDDEMKQRIENHRTSRGKTFATIEEPYDLGEAISRLDASVSVVVIDCLTVWLGNLFFKSNNDEKKVLGLVSAMISDLKKASPHFFIVTNEIGWGIVPENELSRKFRDVAGYLNQAVAHIADAVYLMCCGIPLKIKELELKVDS
jgi:adenosylcobinamide kinase/adenosylcobinamide-phosphate guanylyltransferase